MWDVSDDGHQDLLTAIAEAGGEGRFATVDVTSRNAVEEAVEEVVAAWGGVDVRSHPHSPHGQPEDIAEAYLWLACDAASFVNGAVLSVDGGLVLGT